MNEKDMNTAVAKLLEATARLEDSTSNLNKAINKMIAVIFMSICSMAICCIILSIIAIYLYRLRRIAPWSSFFLPMN